MMNTWANKSIFYHIYPLGFCGAPATNDFSSQPVQRLDKVLGWLEHIQSLGANAIYLGPVFESSQHGYDTADYYHVDRRLGTNETLKYLSGECHRRGIRLILDGVFNHVGRDFWAFRHLRQEGENSPYRDWFHNLRFGSSSSYGDPFVYEGWHGYNSLVKLNLSNLQVREHLFNAVLMWVNEFDIDGLRLDAADCVDLDFWQAFAAHCHGLKPDFWLMGEVVHGDYTRWANPQRLDSVTNYECYKGLYSSLNDANYFEIAYALDRQFGSKGIYRDLPLYNFVDNHDVDRVASMIKEKAHLYPLYIMMFSMPGVPSLYYGSEWGIEGKRTPQSDDPVRPNLDLATLSNNGSNHDLAVVIAKLARIRSETPSLSEGDYHTLHTNHQQFAFTRHMDGETILVALNSVQKSTSIELTIPGANGTLVDLLNPGEKFEIHQGKITLPLNSNWGRILKAFNH